MSHNAPRAAVKSVRRIGDTPFISMTLHSPVIAEKAAPGKFLHIACGGESSALTLRRPFSIAGADPAAGDVRVCFDVKGAGTGWLASAREGDALDLLGPLGNGYPLFADRVPLLVGGGTGIYSVLFLAERLRSRAKALLGFRTASLVNSLDDFRAAGCALSVITDDGSFGEKGYVSDLLSTELEYGGYDVIYACGPLPMLKSVAAVARGRVKCFVSLEEKMGCGVGACMACVTRTVSGYKRVCADGPVFDAAEVEFK